MAIAGAQERISAAALAWAGVTAVPHRYGGTEFRLGRWEIGHIHGDYLVDVPFPTAVRDELVAGGRAEPHHILSGSGWVSLYLREAADVQRAVDLLRQSYELAASRRRRQESS